MSNARNIADRAGHIHAFARFEGSTDGQGMSVYGHQFGFDDFLDQGVGRYYLYLANHISNGNYAFVVSRNAGGGAGGKIYAWIHDSQYVGVLSYDQNGAYQDASPINVIVISDT